MSVGLVDQLLNSNLNNQYSDSRFFLVLFFSKSSEFFAPWLSCRHKGFVSRKLFLKTLKTEVEMFFDLRWHIIRIDLFLEHSEVMRFPGNCFAKKSDSLVFLSDNQILPSVPFFAGISFLLLLLVFRSLGWSFWFRQ